MMRHWQIDEADIVDERVQAGSHQRANVTGQPPKTRVSKGLLVWFAVILTAAAAGSALYRTELTSRLTIWGQNVPTPAMRPVSPAAAVAVVQVRTDDVPIYVYSIGTVQAYNTVNVKARVDGYITEILFKEGQDVKAGDLLAKIDPVPYQAQLQQQEAARASKLAQLGAAELDLKRYETLAVKDFATRQQVDNQRALVEQYRADLLSFEAQINYAKAQLNYATIVSPIDGKVGVRQVDVGNYVQASSPSTIAVITQLQPISVIFTISSVAAATAQLRPGGAKIPVLAFAPDQTTELDRGIVETVDNQVDPTSGTIKLKATFPNTSLRLWPGDFVNGRVIVDTQRDTLTVPSSAVRHGPNQDFVWVVNDDKVVYTPVTIGQIFGGRTVLKRGPPAGTTIVVDGHYRLDNGTPVQIVRTDKDAAPGARTTSASK
ncbi:efflux RND transporter periplasmic adaptor subunit [Bradyrhizobium ontarionense]|uniref:Efflux RND transporter periplasmic adaptor subunit n=1 Tax=Bradyrhizobium ontarionense TaxID=2898149 RepID=A0ABY3R917_9BRAD|nr:efflux RND transporter periplasmic adaptor subunit [Bradyrhizobium sp. A19]UFZ03296.1 efflux RND transporter periplasmic adaptor subunit [Bradyrhizobium sp. A19]